MNLSRRMFLGGAIAAIGAASLPKVLNATPIIFGNGIDDDWAGLDALWNGRPVRMLTEAVSVSSKGEVEMLEGRFLVSKTLHVRKGGPFIRMTGGSMIWPQPVECCIIFENGGTGIDFTQMFLQNGPKIEGDHVHPANIQN